MNEDGMDESEIVQQYLVQESKKVELVISLLSDIDFAFLREVFCGQVPMQIPDEFGMEQEKAEKAHTGLVDALEECAEKVDGIESYLEKEWDKADDILEDGGDEL